MSLPILLALLPMSASAAEVDMSGRWLDAMLPPDVEEPEKGPGPWVSARAVELVPTDDAVRLKVTWSIQVVEPGWVDLPLVDASVRVDRALLSGQSVALKSLSDGRRHLVAWITKPGQLVLEGEVVGDLRRGLGLDLLPAAAGTVRVITPDPVVDLTTGGLAAVELDGVFWTAAGQFEVATSSEAAADKIDLLVVASVGLGVTVGDGDLRVRGRIRWQVARGVLEGVSFTARGAGADLDVTGPLVAGWTRSGDQVFVELLRPETAGLEVEVRWSSPLPAGDEASLALPELQPSDVFRTERAVQIARDGDREIVPSMAGWEATSSLDLPEVARDLVVGTPASAWTSSTGGGGTLQLLKFTPVSGPPTIVDIAAYDGALSADGRLLMRAHYTVRNDRGAFLRVKLAPDTRVVGARVGGEPTAIARDGDDWLVPLLKSVETVQGLLDFPIDLLLLADGVPFDPRDERSLALPVVDAEVAVTRVELSLPVGWRDLLEPGELGRVEDFSEGSGITYGFSTGEATKVAEADALFQDALDGWMSNDFDRAQQSLEDLKNLGASNANIERLQSNIDLVFQPDTGKGDASGASAGAEVALQRRVKEQALARSSKDQEVQQQLMEEADKAYWSGDYTAAQSSYQQALEIGENLERLEQEESVDRKVANEKLKEKLEKSNVEYKKKTEISFDDAEDIDGELVKPQGQLLLDRRTGGDYRGMTEANEPAVDPGYSESTGMAAGVTVGPAQGYNPNIGGAASNEYSYQIDGRFAADPEPAPPVTVEPPPADGNLYGGYVEIGLEEAPASELMSGYDGVDQPAPARARNGGGGGIAMGKKSASPPPPPPSPPPQAVAPARDVSSRPKALSSAGKPQEPMEAPPSPVEIEGFAPLEVTASSLDVVIPAFGDTVRYQHLLLPAGQAHAIVLRVKKKRGDP
jgi:hypothetical protein